MPLRRNRDFLLLWTGQAVSAVGSNAASLAYPLLALAVTGSATLAGAVGFAAMAATTLVRLPAGALADRYPLKPLMIGSDLVRAASTTAVVAGVVTGRVTLALLVVTAVLGAAAGAVSESAQAVAVRHVVPAGQLPTALAQNEARGHLAGLTGQPAGGYLYALGAALPVLADALSYLASAILTGRIRTPAMGPDPAGPTARDPMWREILAGLRHLWHTRFLRTTMLCATAINVVFAGLSLTIIASQATPGTAAPRLGVAFSMGALGGILGAWASARAQRWLSPAGLVYGFGWTATLALVALGRTHDPYLIGALLAAVYSTATPANAMLFAAQIHATPPHLQGRVISAAMLTAGLAAPIGPPLGGLLLDRFGQAAAFTVFAAIVAATTVVMHLSTSIRTMRGTQAT